MHGHVSPCIDFIVFKFGRIGRDLLMRYVRMKPSVNPVRRNFPDFSFIRAVSAALPGKRSYLQVSLLHDPLDFFLIDPDSCFDKGSMHPSISVILINFMDSQDLFF